MTGFSAGNLDVATDCVIEMNEMSGSAIKSLLHDKSSEAKRLLITENGKPIHLIIPQKTFSYNCESDMDIYASELENML